MKPPRTLPSSPSRITVPAGTEPRAETTEPQSYAYGPFRLVPGERIVRRGNQVLPLPPKAFETLLLLVRNPGHLMRKEDLMTALSPDNPGLLCARDGCGRRARPAPVSGQ